MKDATGDKLPTFAAAAGAAGGQTIEGETK